MKSSSSSNGTQELSQWFNRSATGQGTCMKFRYMMYGSSVLRVLQTISDDEVGEKAIWMDDNATHPVLNYGQVSIGRQIKSKVLMWQYWVGSQ
jgi:hypothetical protein